MFAQILFELNEGNSRDKAYVIEIERSWVRGTVSLQFKSQKIASTQRKCVHNISWRRLWRWKAQVPLSLFYFSVDESLTVRKKGRGRKWESGRGQIFRFYESSLERPLVESPLSSRKVHSSSWQSVTLTMEIRMQFVNSKSLIFLFWWKWQNSHFSAHVRFQR